MTPLAIVAVVLAASAACGGDDDETVSTSPPVSATSTSVATTPEPSPAPPTSEEPTVPSSSTPDSTDPPVSSSVPPPSTDAGSQPPELAAAVADLAGRLSIDPGAVTVVDHREVTWPDSSLGCPQPGMQYLQRLTNGVLAILEAGGTRYEYHAGAGRPLFLCTNPRPPVKDG